MAMANTLAYYDTVTITAVKSFIVQAPYYNRHTMIVMSDACAVNVP